MIISVSALKAILHSEMFDMFWRGEGDDAFRKLFREDVPEKVLLKQRLKGEQHPGVQRCWGKNFPGKGSRMLKALGGISTVCSSNREQSSVAAAQPYWSCHSLGFILKTVWSKWRIWRSAIALPLKRMHWPLCEDWIEVGQEWTPRVYVEDPERVQVRNEGGVDEGSGSKQRRDVDVSECQIVKKFWKFYKCRKMQRK